MFLFLYYLSWTYKPCFFLFFLFFFCWLIEKTGQIPPSLLNSADGQISHYSHFVLTDSTAGAVQSTISCLALLDFSLKGCWVQVPKGPYMDSILSGSSESGHLALLTFSNVVVLPSEGGGGHYINVPFLVYIMACWYRHHLIVTEMCNR